MAAATPKCTKCKTNACLQGQDCFGHATSQKQLYQDDVIYNLQHATAKWDMQKTPGDPRLLEIVRFAQLLDCKTVGLAFCISVAAEAKVIANILADHFQVVSVCCKTGGISKADINLPDMGKTQIVCNPAGQADLLNKAQTQLNIMCGLCVGHDAIFTKVSDAPTTTIFVKDRALKHNPVAAIHDDKILNKIKTDLQK